MNKDIPLERTKLELKYCECCGGLWLRQKESQESRCGACVRVWADLPGAWIRGLKHRAVEIGGGRRGLMLVPRRTAGGQA